MSAPLSDKAIAQAFREAVRDWNTEAHWHIVHASIQERARELDAASHGEDERGPESACYQAYQAVGSMLSDLGLFDTEKGQKLLDNLSQARVVHDDVLPWESASHGEDIHSCSPYCERPECVRLRGEDEARVEAAAKRICAANCKLDGYDPNALWEMLDESAKLATLRMARAALAAKGE